MLGWYNGVFGTFRKVAMVESMSYGKNGSGDGLARFEVSVERPIGL